MSSLTIPMLLPELSPSTTVYLVLGDIIWPVHKILLDTIPYFTMHLNYIPTPPNSPTTSKLTKSGHEVRVKLPPATVPTMVTFPSHWGLEGAEVSAFVTWIYTKDLKGIEADVLMHFWVFAARLGAKRAMNDAIVAIEKVRWANNIVETGMLRWVWDATCDEEDDEGEVHQNVINDGVPSGSVLKTTLATTSHLTKTEEDLAYAKMHEWEKKWKGSDGALRRLLVDQCAWKLDCEWLRNNPDQFPKKFLLALTSRMREVWSFKVGKKAPFEKGNLKTYFVD